jgi:hypothetical protein
MGETLFGWLTGAIDAAMSSRLARVLDGNVKRMAGSDRAFILALTAVHRFDLVHDVLPSREALDDPFAFDGATLKRCEAAMVGLIDTYMRRADQFTAASGGQPGGPIDNFHRGNVLAAQVWLATLEMALASGTRETVSEVWDGLLSASHHLPETIESLTALEGHVLPRIFARLSQEGWPYRSAEDWEEACRRPTCAFPSRSG